MPLIKPEGIPPKKMEFLLEQSAATGVFFIIMVMALIDVMAGFSVSIRSSGRDINYN